MKLTDALVRPPAANFASGLTSASLGRPDVVLALAQHELYCEALERCGLSLRRLPADPRFPDATFVEDTAIVTPRGAILARPGAPSRAGEVAAIGEALGRSFPRLEAIEEPGTVDGGDVCEAGTRYFVGISERTNEHGAWQLARLLRGFGYDAALVDIRGVPGLLHLKSGLAWLGADRLAAIPALAGLDPLRGCTIVPVDPAEAYAANCILVNDHVLIASGFPLFENTVLRLGLDVISLDMSEFRKMDGGLSCLSIRYGAAP